MVANYDRREAIRYTWAQSRLDSVEKENSKHYFRLSNLFSMANFSQQGRYKHCFSYYDNGTFARIIFLLGIEESDEAAHDKLEDWICININ